MPNMNMLSTAELTQMQADAARGACDQPCTIKRATLGSLASGGQSQTPQVVSPAGLLAGLSEPTASMLQNYGYLVGSLAAWQVKFPVGTSVLENDQIIIGGQTLSAVKVFRPRSYEILLTVLASEAK